MPDGGGEREQGYMMGVLKGRIRLVLCAACLILSWRVYSLYVRYGSPELPAAALAETADAGLVPADVLPTEELAGGTPSARERTSVAAVVVDESILAAQRSAASQPWGRDPFSAAVNVIDAGSEDAEREDEIGSASGPPPPPSLAFSAVCGRGDKWSAVVRGNIVRVGDMIDNEYRVTRIGKGSLTLSRGAWVFRYELGTNDVVVQKAEEER